MDIFSGFDINLAGNNVWLCFEQKEFADQAIATMEAAEGDRMFWEKISQGGSFMTKI